MPLHVKETHQAVCGVIYPAVSLFAAQNILALLCSWSLDVPLKMPSSIAVVS
jgi:hypothetical protein